MHPILFKLGPLTIHSYGLMMVIAYFSTMLFIYYNAEKIGFPREDGVDVSILAFLSGLVGARIMFVMLNSAKYKDHWDLIFNLKQGGLAWHGGLIGGILAVIIYCKIKKYSPALGLDLTLTPLIMSLGIGRMGCFLNGCCHGVPTHLPWGVVFPYNRPHVAVHPTQIYEMILDFIAFFILYNLWHKRKYNGQLALMMIWMYAVIRFVVEIFRFNTKNLIQGGFSTAQWGSILMFVLAFSAWLYYNNKYKNINENKDDNKSHEGEELITGISH